MVVDALIDTGAIVAILDRDDSWHSLCNATLRQLRFPLLTSEAVLTETFHLIRRSRLEVETAWGFIRSGAVSVATIEDAELSEIRGLMSRYSDRPMDFADATLVYLANRERLSTVFTIDHADFHTYRIGGRSRFRVVPVDRP
jgi:hypothetical protein